MNIHLFKNNYYLCTMRVKDIAKQQAVIDATIKVINEIGFASASISKIAKEAGVSVGTIYIYYENKEDLVINVYYEVKKSLTEFYYQDLETTSNVKTQLNIFFNNVVKAGSSIPQFVAYAEQFANSPFHDKIDQEKMQVLAKPLLLILSRGVQEHKIKELSLELFVAFFVVPANFLGNRKLCSGFNVNKKSIDQAFELAWETIKNKN